MDWAFAWFALNSLCAVVPFITFWLYERFYSQVRVCGPCVRVMFFFLFVSLFGGWGVEG
jgi:hypothetical protein